MAASPNYPGTPNNGAVQILPADTTSKKTLFTAGASGGRVHSVSVASDDTAAHDLQVWSSIGGTDYLVGTVSIPAGSGNTSGVPQVNVLAALVSLLDPSGYWVLKAAEVIKISVPVAITAAKTLHASARGADF